MDLKSLEFVRVELGDGLAVLEINRPRSLNALNRAVLGELDRALDALAGFDSLAALVLTGHGERAFVAGADIEEMSQMSPAQAEELSALGQGVTRRIEQFPVPVLAAVNGYALGGGCELALACDIIYASDNAKLGQPEVKLGLIPGFGGAARLPRRIGLAAASEWIYTGEIFTAQQAQTLGLVREVLPAEELLPRVKHVAQTIAKRGPLAVRAAKRVIRGGLGADLRSALDLERAQFAALFDTDDMREGTRAFVEKREPQFHGR